ncbi:secretion protein EccK [Mycobacterium sp. PS03-16]|uniref:secretion protein EccK n=1 Tax=Mycobacterium sp. PS03-16 TaxID=2559611 RepID=UPI001FD7F36B|nr:secretion protein EccK [Mycobacterium sp. PS03-16]
MAPAAPNAASVAGAPAPVPVSAARAERDAIAGSMRRQSSGDPVQVARRIGAALNAYRSIDFGFFWLTGVTKEGTLLVANSYGIGYIPDGVKLPEQVKMVSADESIPLEERAKWATFPMLALHGWAQHHDTALRAVVATADQFDGFDPGAARVILQPDDIPEKGDIAGRSRLEIVAPNAVKQLNSVSDASLGDLLPPAPVDANAPEDKSMSLWFDVMKPMMSTAPDRGGAHLAAMVIFADHAQVLAVHRAQTATDAELQRAAIADWVYWQHVSVMCGDAIAVKH